MIVNVLYAGRDDQWEAYEKALAVALAEKRVLANVARDIPAEQVDYIVYAPNGPVSDFTPFVKCKAVLGLWAGVEDIVGNRTLTQPYTRMVDDGLTQGMVEWVTGQVLRHHLGLDIDITRAAPAWQPHVPPLAPDRKVGILGLGELGGACAEVLAALNFDVTGWSRSPRQIDGVRCCHGADGLDAVLSRSEILVLLLPLTAGTENILNADTLARLPQGAVVINPGRGALIDDAALLAALDAGRVGHATLDVFRVEPLPADHPYWANPRVTVTPHIASETRPATAARTIAENVRRGEKGEPFLYLVDRSAGY